MYLIVSGVGDVVAASTHRRKKGPSRAGAGRDVSGRGWLRNARVRGVYYGNVGLVLI